jgi:hypothetical protein
VSFKFLLSVMSQLFALRSSTRTNLPYGQTCN